MTARFTTIAIQWLVAAAFLAWGCILMVFIFGEDSPEMTISFGEFFIIKLMALGSAYSTYKAGVWCYERGLFPTIITKWVETCEAEEE